MLKLKPSCEHCDCTLPANSTDAMICSFECTFCRDCVEEVLHNVCPNCGGGFVPRPIRPSKEHVEGISLTQYPAVTEKTHKPVDAEKHQRFAADLKTISPQER